MGDGVLCGVDSDDDGYTEVDLSIYHYCQPQTEVLLCKKVHLDSTSL